MPISRRRKRKDGKTVKRKEEGARIVVDPNKESHVTLQDLINVVAYQEYVKDGSIVPEDVEIQMADEIPVNIINEDGSRTQVGTAARNPEDPDRVSIDINDPRAAAIIRGAASLDKVSIEEDEDER